MPTWPTRCTPPAWVATRSSACAACMSPSICGCAWATRRWPRPGAQPSSVRCRPGCAARRQRPARQRWRFGVMPATPPHCSIAPRRWRGVTCTTSGPGSRSGCGRPRPRLPAARRLRCWCRRWWPAPALSCRCWACWRSATRWRRWPRTGRRPIGRRWRRPRRRRMGWPGAMWRGRWAALAPTLAVRCQRPCRATAGLHRDLARLRPCHLSPSPQRRPCRRSPSQWTA